MKYIFDENNRLIGRTENPNMTGLEIGTEPPPYNPTHQHCSYTNSAWVLIDRDRSSDAMKILRRDRNAKLSESDWRMVSDYPGTNQTEWQTYRQALRDITTQTPSLDGSGNLTGITWPTPPTD